MTCDIQDSVAFRMRVPESRSMVIERSIGYFETRVGQKIVNFVIYIHIANRKLLTTTIKLFLLRCVNPAALPLVLNLLSPEGS